MKGHDIPDPSEPVQAVSVQPLEDGGVQTDEIEGVEAEEAQAEADERLFQIHNLLEPSRVQIM